MLTLTPRAAPALPTGSGRMTVITWNCTKSDHPKKLEQIAELVWGPANRDEFADLVLIQEFSQNMAQYQDDYDELCAAFEANQWGYLKTPNQGPAGVGKPKPTGSGCYFLVWNSKRLGTNGEFAFIDDVTAATTAAVKVTSSDRPSKQTTFYDPARLADENNPPLALALESSIRPIMSGRLPVACYTVHISPVGAAARIPNLDQDVAEYNTRSYALEVFTKVARVVQDASEAMSKSRLFLFAGDLNVGPDVVKQYFRPTLGFRIASGGGKQLDHIVACYGGSVGMQKFDPPVFLKPGKSIDQVGDHYPLGAHLELL